MYTPLRVNWFTLYRVGAALCRTFRGLLYSAAPLGSLQIRRECTLLYTPPVHLSGELNFSFFTTLKRVLQTAYTANRVYYELRDRDGAGDRRKACFEVAGEIGRAHV